MAKCRPSILRGLQLDGEVIEASAPDAPTPVKSRPATLRKWQHLIRCGQRTGLRHRRPGKPLAITVIARLHHRPNPFRPSWLILGPQCVYSTLSPGISACTAWKRPKSLPTEGVQALSAIAERRGKAMRSKSRRSSSFSLHGCLHTQQSSPDLLWPAAARVIGVAPLQRDGARSAGPGIPPIVGLRHVEVVCMSGSIDERGVSPRTGTITRVFTFC